jgi:MOSC domain-containing protein YiiM
MKLVDRGTHGVTVAEAGRIVNFDRDDLDGARRVLAIEALGSSVRMKLEARLARGGDIGADTKRLYLADDQQAN